MASDPAPTRVGHVAGTLRGIVRRHIDAMRDDRFEHPAATDLLRQYREYGYGMIRMLVAYHDAHGITDRACLMLAVELEAAYREAVKRARAAALAGVGRVRGGTRWRSGRRQGRL